jgi:uncharacterized membrane protein
VIVAPHLLPAWAILGAAVLMAVVVGAAAATAPWRALRAAPARQHLLFGGMIALLLLWLLTIRVSEGVWIHLLGITTLTMIVGWRFTVLGASFVLVAHLLLLGIPVSAAPVAWVFSVALPATATRLLVHGLRRHGAKNLFIYLLGAGFGGGLACVALIALASLPFLWLIGQPRWLAAAVENAPLLWLLMFPEGFINGMLVTAFTVFFPGGVKTFDEAFYLDG